MSQLLSYSHYVELLAITNLNEIKYYIKVTEENSLSVRELRKRIKSKEYDRLVDSVKIKFTNDEPKQIQDFIKNPIFIYNKNKYDVISEKVLQRLILEDISSFLNELGEGFTFIKNEYKIRIGTTYNYIDLLLFNIEYNCYVVVELKVTELKKEHIGQIEIYMNYIDKNLRKIVHDKTIGIIVCKKKNEFVIEYCSDSRIIGREYKIVL